MSKRKTNFKLSLTKKPRLDELNDLWDDEFDGEIIDECFDRATQVFEEVEDKNVATNDLSLPSSYGIFKDQKQIITSTQCTQPAYNNQEVIITKIQELQEKYAVKEGEVAVLRSNLQRLRATNEVDQHKKELEWKERLSGFEKENKTMKSELEFKNLEIVNLKQQIAELSKHLNNEQYFTQKSQVVDKNSLTATSPEKYVTTAQIVNPRIYINIEKYYFLRPHYLSLTSEEIQGQMFHFNKGLDCSSQHKLKAELAKKFDIHHIHQEILPLKNLSLEDLSSDKSIPCIDKVLNSSIQLLKNFYDYLNVMEVEKCSSYPENFDLQFLQNSSFAIIQASSMCGEIITLLGEFMPFSAYLKCRLLTENNSHIDEFLCCQELFKEGLKRIQTPNCFNLLSDILSVIGRNNVEKYCPDFLSAVIKLLCRIYSMKNFNSISQNTVEEILKQLLSLNADLHFLCQVTIFFKIVTRWSNFIYYLCPDRNNQKDRPIKGASDHENVATRFPVEFCRLHIYICLLEDIIMKIQNGKLFCYVSANILSFTYNIFRSDNAWLHQQENKGCECLRKLCKLTVGIIFKSIEIAETTNSLQRSFLKNHVTLLNLLTFNVYDLTQRYVTDFASFKEIVYRLTNTGGKVYCTNLNKLEKLSATEELPEIAREKFFEVNL